MSTSQLLVGFCVFSSSSLFWTVLQWTFYASAHFCWVHVLHMFSALVEITKQFPKSVVWIYSSPNRVWRSSCLQPYQHLVFSVFFLVCTLVIMWECLILVLVCISPMPLEVELIFMSVGHLENLFSEVPDEVWGLSGKSPAIVNITRTVCVTSM